MRSRTMLAVLLCAAPLPVAAGAMDKALTKLGPEERSNQVCVLKGLDAVRADARLRKADRMQPATFSPVKLDASRLVAKGGAVRSGNHWYALSYTCVLSSDLMKATSFTFQVGQEIPAQMWEKYGLWR